MNSADSTNSGCTAPFMFIWLVGWSTVTLMGDGFVFVSLFKQFHSLTYNEVSGIITKSEVKVVHDSDGSSYRWDIEYSYEVDGVGYTNDRRRYGFDSNSRKQVQRLVREYAVQKPVAVYHNSADPNDSVLVRGVSAMDFFPPLFLIPFNVVMVGVFSFTVGPWLRGWFSTRPVTIKVWQRDVIWFAKVYKSLPIAVACVTALAISFLSTFVVAFGQLLLPAWTLVIPAWCLVILGSLYAYLKTGPTVRLEIDEFHQRLTARLPGQSDPAPTDFASVRSIEAQGDAVVLETASAPLKLSCSGESDARWLRDWLQTRWRGGSRD